MPRKKGTNKRFTTVSIEEDLRQEWSRTKFSGEPLYQTAFRKTHTYNKDEIAEIIEISEQRRKAIQTLQNRILELETERTKFNRLEQYI